MRRKCEDCGTVTRAKSGVCRKCQKVRAVKARWGSLSAAAKAWTKELHKTALMPDIFSQLRMVTR